MAIASAPIIDDKLRIMVSLLRNKLPPTKLAVEYFPNFKICLIEFLLYKPICFAPSHCLRIVTKLVNALARICIRIMPCNVDSEKRIYPLINTNVNNPLMPLITSTFLKLTFLYHTLRFLPPLTNLNYCYLKLYKGIFILVSKKND